MSLAEEYIDCFLNFLRGMETGPTVPQCIGLTSFLNFLRGMETRVQRQKVLRGGTFLNYSGPHLEDQGKS